MQHPSHALPRPCAPHRQLYPPGSPPSQAPANVTLDPAWLGGAKRPAGAVGVALLSGRPDFAQELATFAMLAPAAAGARRVLACGSKGFKRAVNTAAAGAGAIPHDVTWQL